MQVFTNTLEKHLTCGSVQHRSATYSVERGTFEVEGLVLRAHSLLAWLSQSRMSIKLIESWNRSGHHEVSRNPTGTRVPQKQMRDWCRYEPVQSARKFSAVLGTCYQRILLARKMRSHTRHPARGIHRARSTKQTKTILVRS